MTTANEIFDELETSWRNTNAQRRRRFLPGLLVSFINLIRHVNGYGGRFASLAELYAAYPRKTTTTAGGQADTLILTVEGRTTQSIRPFYEAFVQWLRIENMRLDYPKAAPHATGKWQPYEHWVEGLLAMSDAELTALEQRTRDFVLAQLPSHARDGTIVKREPLRFSLFLNNFAMKAVGETTGAAYQGTVFGYLRADAAHLQIETARVRSGSKRENRIGDIDALNGDNLVISAEVKQFVIPMSQVDDFREFANQVEGRGALGLIVALDFAEGVREALRGMSLEPVSKRDLQDRVRLWDSLKQRVAVDALIYYVTRIEQNSSLRDRVNSFFTQLEATLAPADQHVSVEATAAVDDDAGDDSNIDAADRAADAIDEHEATLQHTSGDEGQHFDNEGV